jgi:hypothetical protein
MFETQKQIKKGIFWFRETNRKNNRNRFSFGSFRFEPKIFFVCFEDTLVLSELRSGMGRSLQLQRDYLNDLSSTLRVLFEHRKDMGQYGVTSVRQARHCTVHLKVPKREIFLTELIILSYPIWTGDLGTKAKNRFL